MNERTPISDYRDFRLFYTDFVKHGKSSAVHPVPLWGRKYGKKTLKLGGHVTVHFEPNAEGVSRFTYGYATPTDLTRELAEQSVIQIDNDTLFAKLIVFEDEAHLYLVYNQIIGQRWIASVNLSTLPPEMFHEDEA